MSVDLAQRNYNELAARLARLETLLQDNDAYAPPGAVTLAELDLGPGLDFSVPTYDDYINRPDPNIIWDPEATSTQLDEKLASNDSFVASDQAIIDLMARLLALETMLSGGSNDTNQSNAQGAGAGVGDDTFTGTGRAAPPTINQLTTILGSTSLAFAALPLSLANGGTAGTTASTARTNLGLGTLSIQDANSVAITGGTLTGMTGVTVSGTTGVDSSHASAANTFAGTLSVGSLVSVADSSATQFVYGDVAGSAGTKSRIWMDGGNDSGTSSNAMYIYGRGPAYAGDAYIKFSPVATLGNAIGLATTGGGGPIQLVSAGAINITANSGAQAFNIDFSTGNITLSAGSGSTVIDGTGNIVIGTTSTTELILRTANAGSVDIQSNASGMIGFFSTAGSVKRTVTGSRGGNAALASLLTQLAGYGLLIDSST